MKAILKTTAAVLLISILFGYLLLCLCHAIPRASMQKQIDASAAYLRTQPLYPVDQFSGHQVDVWADSLMLLLSGYDGDESIFRRAADSYYLRIPDANPHESFIRIASGEDGSRISYSRYWHGYLVFLTPLLTVFNYQQIRLILTITQGVLVVLLASLIRRKLPRALFPYIFLILLLAPTAIGSCMEFSSVFYIMMIVSIVLLSKPRTDDKVIYLFLLSGIATAYFDLLTAPTITLTVPLVLLCLQRKQNRTGLLLKCIVLWAVGYAAMWAGKWVIAFISRGKPFLDDLVQQIKFRSSATNKDQESISRIAALIRNFKTLFKNRSIDVCLAAYAVILLYRDIRNRRSISVYDLDTTLLLYLPFGICVVWILAMANHSSIHNWFTFRTLSPCVFSVLCALNYSRPIDSGEEK